MSDPQKLMPLAIAGGLLFAAYKFAPNAAVRSAVIGVAGIAVARHIHYVNAVI